MMKQGCIHTYLPIRWYFRYTNQCSPSSLFAKGYTMHNLPYTLCCITKFFACWVSIIIINGYYPFSFLCTQLMVYAPRTFSYGSYFLVINAGMHTYETSICQYFTYANGLFFEQYYSCSCLHVCKKTPRTSTNTMLQAHVRRLLVILRGRPHLSNPIIYRHP